MSAHSVYTMRFLYSERVYYIRLFYILIDCRHIWVHFQFQINIQASFVVGKEKQEPSATCQWKRSFYLRIGMLNDPTASC